MYYALLAETWDKKYGLCENTKRIRIKYWLPQYVCGVVFNRYVIDLNMAMVKSWQVI